MMKTISWLIAMVTITVMLINTSTAMAGAYGTGEGHGYASCASTEILYNGTIFRVVRILPDVCPTLYDEIDQQCTLMFKCAFRLVACHLPAREI